MATSDSSREVDDAAADWVARRDRAPLSGEEEAAFQEWLHGDARRPGAMLRAQAVFLRSEAAAGLGPAYDPADFTDAASEPQAIAPSRRRFLKYGAGLAATLVVAGVGIGWRMPRAYATERGERRLIRLEDGSTIFLNTNTRVTVHYGADERTAVLVRGEAYFSAARDRSRPFTVTVGNGRLSTREANFRVRSLDEAPADILVEAGKVDLIADVSKGAAVVALEPRTRVALPETDRQAVRSVPVSPEDVLRDLAWRDGKIAFQGETLAQAADTFARYSDPRIEIRDEGLQQEPITGLFLANDPAGFTRAIAGIFGASVSRTADRIILTRAST